MRAEITMAPPQITAGMPFVMVITNGVPEVPALTD